MQQNRLLPVKDNKTFTLIKSKLCGEKRSATEPTRGVPERIWKKHVRGYLMTEILQKSSFEKKQVMENILLPFIHQATKPNQ